MTRRRRAAALSTALVVALGFLASGGPARARAPEVVAPDAVHVYDGDTFYLGTESIRLRGVDTPERGEPRSAMAARRLAELLRSGPVTIVRRGLDVYGRTLADVYVGGRNVADVLRREGFEKPRPR